MLNTFNWPEVLWIALCFGVVFGLIYKRFKGEL